MRGPRRWRQERKTYLMRHYGITVAQYNKMLKRQHGRCAICKRPPRSRHLSVDHDHISGRIRGLLDYRCNRFIVGRHRDGRLLQEAADYLNSDFDGRFI